MKSNNYDISAVQQANWKDLDVYKIKDYLIDRKYQYKIDFNADIPQETSLLKELGIVTTQDSKLVPTVAGLLLFGKTPQRFMPSSAINVVKFKGKDTGGLMIDRKELKGTIPELIDQAASFLVTHMKLTGKIEAFRRVDTLEYPLEALREGITNAVIHRDYSVTGSLIRIFMFDDRIEIYSPGGLSEGVTIETMEHTQFSRNNAIVKNILHMGSYMEGLGTGIKRIKTSIKERGLRNPKFIDTTVDFLLILFGQEISFKEEENEAKGREIKKIKPIAKEQTVVDKPSISPRPHLIATQPRVSLRSIKRKKKFGKKFFVSLLSVIAVIVLFFSLYYGSRQFESVSNGIASFIYEVFPNMKISAKTLYRKAAVSHAKKNYRKALLEYKAFIELYPKDSEAMNASFYLAACYDLLNKPEAAIEVYEKLIKDYPNTDKAIMAQYWIATIYMHKEDLSTAIKLFNYILEKYPDNEIALEAIKNMTVCYEKNKDLHKAIAAYQKMIQLQQNISLGYEYYQQAMLYNELGQIEQVKECLNKILENESSLDKWLKKAEILKEEVEGKEQKEKEIQNKKQSAIKRYYMLGKLYFEEQDYNNAVKQWKEVLFLDPANQEVVQMIGKAQEKMQVEKNVLHE